jgi:hypothetical protein
VVAERATRAPRNHGQRKGDFETRMRRTSITVTNYENEKTWQTKPKPA